MRQLVTTGEVWSSHVANGEAFSAENFVIGAGGLFAHVQLFNPAGSGKRIRLRGLHSISVVASTINVRRHDTPLTTLGLQPTFIVENLLSSVSPGSEVAEMRSESPVVALGAVLWQAGAPGNKPALYPGGGREWGYDLLEDQGLVCQAAAGATMIILMQWVEVSL